MLATEALKSVGTFLVRAVSDAADTEARTEMMYAAMLAGIAFNAAGCHLPHGLSYAVSGLTQDWHVDRLSRKAKTLVPHGMAVVLNNPSVWRFTGAQLARSGTCTARAALALTTDGATPRRRRRRAGQSRDRADARDRRCRTGLPRSASASSDIDALATGAEPQYRVIRNAPKDVGRDDLEALFRVGAQLLVTAAGSRSRSSATGARNARACRRTARERAALAGLALDRRARPGGPQQHVVDDRKAQARAAGRARAAAVDRDRSAPVRRGRCSAAMPTPMSATANSGHSRGVDLPRQRDPCRQSAYSASHCETRLPNALASSSRAPVTAR